MAGQSISELEKTETIPENSTYIVEMGDGSGTKAVTQKTLTEETEKALKIGDLKDLQTEDKTNLVAAINEAAQSGGTGNDDSSSVDILDTQEEIEANTESGKAAGAIVVKEIFTELISLDGEVVKNLYVDNNGKLHMVKGSADSVLPFSGKGKPIAIHIELAAALSSGNVVATVALNINGARVASKTINGPAPTYSAGDAIDYTYTP